MAPRDRTTDPTYDSNGVAAPRGSWVGVYLSFASWRTRSTRTPGSPWTSPSPSGTTDRAEWPTTSRNPVDSPPGCAGTPTCCRGRRLRRRRRRARRRTRPARRGPRPVRPRRAPRRPSPADAARLLPVPPGRAVSEHRRRPSRRPSPSSPGTTAPNLSYAGKPRAAPLPLPALLARATLAFLASPDRSRLHACHAPRCVRYFVKEHPRQEWCKPSSAGTVHVSPAITNGTGNPRRPVELTEESGRSAEARAG